MKTMHVLSPNNKGGRNVHLYTIHKDNNTVIAKYSNDDEWLYPDELAGTITSNGEGITITIDKKVIKLDYAEEELLLSMLIANREEPITFNHIEKTIELCS